MKKYQHFTVTSQNIQIPQQTFSKNEFFKKKFIWMSDNFGKDILPEIEEIITPASYVLTSLKLNRSLSDSSIRKILGKDEVVSLHQWAQETCALMEEQSEGQAGPLLTDGYANVRYVQSSSGTILAIGVLWIDGVRQWYCCAWELDISLWSDDCGFFIRS